ncbi:MAG: urease accessory UreF family protein, partial [Ginsengibacter sp.]
GLVTSKESAMRFIKEQLTRNIFYTDAALVSLAYAAAEDNCMNEILELDMLCTAVKLPGESRNASNKIGLRLLKIFRQVENCCFSNQYYNEILSGKALGHYCIAFGILAQSLHAGKHESVAGFYYNAASAFVINAVKLVPLGQQDGQEMLLALFPLIDKLAGQSMDPNKKMIGYCCAGFDIRCMQHEKLYSRLYMS